MSEKYDDYIAVSDKGTRKVLGTFIKILPTMNNKKVLDVGCGTGLLLEKYIENNKTIGIDNNKESLQIASKKGIKIKVFDLEKKLDFPNEDFDLVICKDVLEFIFHAEQLLDEMIRITKKDGFILLHIPNEFTIRDQIGIAAGKGIIKKRWYRNSNELNNPHIRFFTQKSLVKITQSKNLVVEKDFSKNWSLPFPGFSILSKISPRLFSPGTTLLLKKK